MWSKFRDTDRMMTVEDELHFVRPKIVEWVEHLRGRGNTRMRAYGVIAAEVGKSPTWVRRIVGRSPDIEVRLRDAWNVAAAYDRLCARIEAAADAQEAINAARKEAHALREGPDPVGGVETHRPAGLAPMVDQIRK